MAFPVYDGLLHLYEQGCRRVSVLTAGDPPGCVHPRDSRAEGIRRFRETVMKGDPGFHLELVNDLVDRVLEIIDDRPSEPVVRRIKPKIVRENLYQ